MMQLCLTIYDLYYSLYNKICMIWESCLSCLIDKNLMHPLQMDFDIYFVMVHNKYKKRAELLSDFILNIQYPKVMF